jgi:UDPglucose 6-dehydrogenase
MIKLPMLIGENQKVCLVGIWHLGSVYSACLADMGYQIIGVDKDANRVLNLNHGEPPIFEPGLKELVSKNIAAGRLSYSMDFEQALKETKYILITFDTPVDDNDEVDLSPVLDTCSEIAQYLANDSIIIICSQIPIGTCDRIRKLIKEKNPSLDFDIACCPENLRLGGAIGYFMKPDRIVIGADSKATLDSVEDFFSIISSPKIRMNLRSAEMTKHAINAFLATTISFANEIANLCDELGADALKIAEAMKTESRIGNQLPLLPGLAFAGGTLARDLKVLKKLGQNSNYETPLIDGVLTVNQRQNYLVMRKLKKIYGSIDNLNISILGLTYKAGTSTLRRSASIEIIKDLVDNGASVKAYDPKASVEEVRQHKEFVFLPDPYVVVKGADALVIITDWPEFKTLDFDLIKKQMNKPVVIDAKNMLDSEQMIKLGFVYSGVGRGSKI